MLASTWDCAGSSAVVSVAVNSSNEPRTFETIMCRARNDTSLWTGSIVQVPVL